MDQTAEGSHQEMFTGAQTPNLWHGPVTSMGKYGTLETSQTKLIQRSVFKLDCGHLQSIFPPTFSYG